MAKTANIRIYTAYGTSHKVIDIYYRNNLLYRFEGDDLRELVGQAHLWIYNSDHKFTGTKTQIQL